MRLDQVSLSLPRKLMARRTTKNPRLALRGSRGQKLRARHPRNQQNDTAQHHRPDPI